MDAKIIELLETEIKYEGYINKALDQVAKMKRMEEKRIPKNIDWDAIDSIATEARQKFRKSILRPLVKRVVFQGSTSRYLNSDGLS